MQNLVQTPGTKFQEIGVSARTLEAIDKVGYHTPSPIQAAFLPVALKGTDCIGQARTGTGKTAAFVIPILDRIDSESPQTQALILTPTRELSEQVSQEAARLADTSPCRTACLVGGRPIRHQLNTLRKGVQIAIGTPGRVLDLISRRALDLSNLKIVVLDEADRMLDIGFRPDIEKILRSCPKQRQTMLLSATVPPPVERLAQRYMQNPSRIDLSSDGIAVESIRQFYITVDADRKVDLLSRLLLKERPRQALVFTRTKRRAESLYQKFVRKLPQTAHLHGDLAQSMRDRVMKNFREGKVRLLIATDVVGRGIDVSSISHIVNFDIPEYCDDYVHRVGRTGRMSSKDSGNAFTFVTPGQGDELTRIEIRINLLLEEYKIDEFDAHRPIAPAKQVEPNRNFHVA